jgi:serine/threonine-protein kinase HipA
LVGDRQLFTFDSDYSEDTDRPTLSLSFKGQSGRLLTEARPVARRVPPFFSNLLPEGQLRSCLAARAGINPDREFFLLAELGQDLSGATIVSPGAVGDTCGALRFSLAGVQLKFSAILEASGGLTIPATGVGGSWIVKLPSMHFDAVAENEFVMLELARDVGIRVPPNRLVEVSTIGNLPREASGLAGRALAVQRFDRDAEGRRIHMEDFAQVFGLFPEAKYGAASYGSIARVLWAESGEADAMEFVRRVAFSVAIGNGDMHLKNWSLLYPDGRNPTLSPAYDLVSTIPYIAGDRLALTFGGGRELAGISPEQTRRFADKTGLPHRAVSRTVIETIDRTADSWRASRHKHLLPEALATAVDRQIGRVVEFSGRHGGYSHR